MDPVTATILAILTIASGAASAYSTQQAGKAQSNALKYNADLARREADAKERATREASRRKQKQLRSLEGTQRTLFAKAGVSLTEGTPLEIMAHSAQQASLDRSTEYQEGFAQASQSRAESILLRSQAKSVRRTANLDAASTLLNTAAKVMGE
jgi:hypothetical protein